MHDASGRDLVRRAQEHASDRLLAEIDGKAPHAAREDQQLVETRSRQTANSRHAIADLDNPADRIEPRFERQVPDVLAVSVELGAGLCRKRFGYEVTLQAGSRFRGSLDVPWPPF